MRSYIEKVRYNALSGTKARKRWLRSRIMEEIRNPKKVKAGFRLFLPRPAGATAQQGSLRDKDYFVALVMTPCRRLICVRRGRLTPQSL